MTEQNITHPIFLSLPVVRFPLKSTANCQYMANG